MATRRSATRPTLDMTEVYDGTGAFKDYKPAKSKMVHTWYAYPMESFMAAYAPKANSSSPGATFSGKPVFFTPAGFMNWPQFHTHLQGGSATSSNTSRSARRTRATLSRPATIVGAVCYNDRGRSLPSYWRETELRLDIRIINPSPDEVKKLTAANLTPWRSTQRRYAARMSA